MSVEKTGVVLTASFLAAFLFVQAWLLFGAERTVTTFGDPIFANSTHSILFPEIRPEAAVDGDPRTFWFDRGLPGADARRPVVLIPYDGLYLTFHAGLTHRPGRTPEPLKLYRLGILAGAPDGQRREYARPSRIRLSYFEQPLYQINHDYRFPDLPVFVAARDFTLTDSPEEQWLSLDFVPAPPPSAGFPDQVRARWFRMEVLATFPGERPDVAVRELRTIAETAR